MGELYSLLVLKLGLSPEYVLDEISFYEINSLMKYQYYKDMENWEQTRMLGFIIARSNGSKINKIEKLIKFPWEEKEKNKRVFISDEKMKSFREKAQWIIENNILEQ